MKVTLRRAASLQEDIKNYYKELAVYSTASFVVNKYFASEKMFEDASVGNLNKMTLQLQLMGIRTKLRVALGNLNASSGVSGLLAEDAGIQEVFATVKALVGAVKPSDVETFFALYTAAVDKQSTPEAYGCDTIYSVILTQNDVDGYNKMLATIKRRRNEISDALLAINTSIMVEVAGEDWKVLEDIGIV